MKLNINDIRYIVNEAASRMIKMMYGNKKQEDFSIGIDEIEMEIPEYFEEELDNYDGPYDINVSCLFRCFDGQRGSYEQEPISPYCTLEDVTLGDNTELEQQLSSELFSIITNSAIDYVWKHSTQFEEEANQVDGPDYSDIDDYYYRKGLL